MGWKTIRRRREELGYTAWLSVRKMSEVPSHGRKSLFTAIWMGRYWQQDQFRSSFAPPNGREISFGVVRLVDLRLNALYLVRKPTLKEKAPLDWGFRGQISRFYYSETRLAANASEKTAPKLVWLPTGLSRLLAVSGDDFKYSELVSLLGFLRRAYQSLPMSVLQACSLGEKWRHGLPVLSVPAGPRTHPLHRRQRDGSKRAQ